MKNLIIKLILSFFVLFIPFLLNGAEVDLNGFLSHSVEIKLPPGTNGLAPNLSLEYNSGSGNGILGQGWILNGLPAITRDTTNGIKYDATDTYTGSSGRLKFQSDGSYHYEYENYSRVERHGSEDNPDYWVETKPEGTKYYYGNYGDIDSASVLALDKNGAIRVWALSRVEDLNGNYYEVNYVQDNGEYYPEKIVYTLGSGTDRIISKKRTVEFEYEGRDDYWPGYWQSAKVETRNRLKSITVCVDVININFFDLFKIEILGRKVKFYDLEYEGGTSRNSIDFSRLANIEELGDDDRVIDRLSFIGCAQQKIDGIFKIKKFSPNSLYNTSSGSWQSLDINGDGRIDLVHIVGGNYVYTWQSKGDGTFAVVKFSPNSSYKTSSGSWQNLDINGDGKIDLVHIVGRDYVNTWISNGDGTFSVVKFSPNSSYKTSSGIWQSLDINGDGKNDLVHIVAGNYVYTWQSKGDGTFTVAKFLPGGEYGVIINTIDGSWQRSDINGDGIIDLVHITGQKYIYTWISKGDGTFIVKKFSPGGEYDKSTGSANPNGDLDHTPDVKYYNSTALGRWQTGDINGDGRTDLIHIVGGTYINSWLSKGDGTFNVRKFSPGGDYDKPTSWTYGEHSVKRYSYRSTSFGRWVSLDINGDGKIDLVHIVGGNYVNAWTSISNDFYVTGISNITGSNINITYFLSTELPNVINPDSSAYKDIANSLPRNLVTSITVNDGRGAAYSKTYDYFNGKFHTGFPEERKNLFFEKIIETDNSTGITTTAYYDQREWYAGNPISIETRSSGGVLKTVDYDLNPDTGTRYKDTHFVKVDKVTTTENIGSGSITKSNSFTYDEDGNVTGITDTADGTPDVLTSISYDKVQGENILNRPLSIKKTSDRTVIQDDVFAYADYNLVSVTKFSSLLTEYGYDDYGNITSIKDPANKVTNIEYDSDYNSFVTKVTNPLGHSVTLENDPKTGYPVTKTDQNGNTTGIEYDGAGRLVGVTNAEGYLVKEIDYHDNLRGNPNSQYTETKIYSDSDTVSTWSRSFYDGLGRIYKTVSYAGTLNSQDIEQQVDITFDSAGRVDSKTIPYINGKQKKLYISYDYDDASRLIKVTLPVSENVSDDVTIETGYAAVSGRMLATKRDPKGNISTALYDSRGRLRKKTEPETAQVTYDYDGAGRLTQTADAGNHVTSITYDSLGRKTSITDPNAGNISYTYDIIGNMTSKTDAIGNTISYSYDSINRLIETDYPDGTPDVTYNYDESSSANGKGRVTSVECGDMFTKYAYDENGNTNYIREKVENIDFIFTMDYDSPYIP